MKEWKKTIKMDVKEEWQNQRTGDNIFIVAKDLYYPDKHWQLWYVGENNRGLEADLHKDFDTKEEALKAAHKYMEKHSKSLVKI